MLEALGSDFSVHAVPENKPQGVFISVDDQFDRRTIGESFAKGFGGAIRIACCNFGRPVLLRSMFAVRHLNCFAFHLFLLIKKKGRRSKLHGVVLENQTGENAGL
jgi:hypothetical protein